MKTKPCANCRKRKPVSEFLPYENSEDGLTGYCSPCWKAGDQARRRRMAVLARDRELFRASPAEARRTRRCSGCATTRSLSEFVRDPDSNDFFPACAWCYRAYEDFWSRHHRDKQGNIVEAGRTMPTGVPLNADHCVVCQTGDRVEDRKRCIAQMEGR